MGHQGKASQIAIAVVVPLVSPNRIRNQFTIERQSKRLGPHPSPRDVEAHLEATARPTDRPDRYGAGLVDAAAALR